MPAKLFPRVIAEACASGVLAMYCDLAGHSKVYVITGLRGKVRSRSQLVDTTLLVAGSMIRSGIFIISSIIGRQVGAPGWLLVVWITGLPTLMAASPTVTGGDDARLADSMFTCAKPFALWGFPAAGLFSSRPARSRRWRLVCSLHGCAYPVGFELLDRAVRFGGYAF